MSRKRPQPPGQAVQEEAESAEGAKVTEIDYKDVALLRKFISDRGKIRSRRITGVTVQEQRELSKAIKTPARWPCCRTPPPVAELGRIRNG